MNDEPPLTVAELTELVRWNTVSGILTWHVCPGCHMGVCRRYRCVTCITEELKEREASK
jgi:hypothetical protein